MRVKLKPHPLMIWDFARPLLLVWLLPLIQSVIKQVITSDAGLEFVLEGIAVAGIFIFSFFKWRSYYILITGKTAAVVNGRFIKNRRIINSDSLSAVFITKHPINLLLGGRSVNIGLINQKSPIKLRLSTKNAKRLTEALKMNNNKQTGNNTLDVSHET